MRYKSIHDAELFIAAARGNIESIRDVLGKGGLINAVNEKGETPLMHASANERVEAVDYLLRRGAAVNMRDRNGWAAVTYAVVSGNAGIVRMLADKNADLDLRESERGYTLLMLAIEMENVGMIRQLLNLGAKTDSVDRNGISTVQHAIATKNDKVVDMVLSNGNPNVLHDIGRKVDEAFWEAGK